MPPFFFGILPSNRLDRGRAIRLPLSPLAMSEPLPPAHNSRPWWVWGNILGLDAVVTALVWLPLFAHSAGARIRAHGFPIAPEFLLLGCCVWFVYAADRLLDGSMRGGPRAERHVFARRHWLWLVAAMLAAAGVSGWLLGWQVSEIVLLWGLKFAVILVVYFIITWLSRLSWPGLTAAGGFGGLMAMAYVQNAPGMVWAQVWRGMMAGFLITVIIQSVRNPAAPAPWTLPRKLLGGLLFASGTALIPYAMVERWPQLASDSTVLLFGTVCALNSLGIRLWERPDTDMEHTMLHALYPWMTLAAGIGAMMEWRVADPWSRPLLLACGITAVLLLILHRMNHLSPAVRRALADAAIIVPGAAMLVFALP